MSLIKAESSSEKSSSITSKLSDFFSTLIFLSLKNCFRFFDFLLFLSELVSSLSLFFVITINRSSGLHNSKYGLYLLSKYSGLFICVMLSNNLCFTYH